MILQKSLKYTDLVLKKLFLLLSMLKTVVLLQIFEEIETDLFFFPEKNSRVFLK